MGDISARLNRNEFACHCKCGFQAVDIDLKDILEDCADNFQTLKQADRCYIVINSACRCRDYNELVQKKNVKNYKAYSSKSKHIFGMAADFYLVIKIGVIKKKIDPCQVADYLEATYKDRYGIGRYTTFTHVDVRPEKARW